jgi:hypothetical protein
MLPVEVDPADGTVSLEGRVVDEPTYIHLSGELPVGTTDVRFRYSTDAAYLDTARLGQPSEGVRSQLAGDTLASATPMRSLGSERDQTANGAVKG